MLFTAADRLASYDERGPLVILNNLRQRQPPANGGLRDRFLRYLEGELDRLEETLSRLEAFSLNVLGLFVMPIRRL